MSSFGSPPGGGGGFGQPPGGQPPGGGGFGQPPGGQPPGGGGFGQPPGGGGFGDPSSQPGPGFGQPPGGPGGSGGFGSPPGAGPEGPKNEQLAIVSVACGVASILSCCCVCFVPLPIAAVITGYLALSRINDNPQGLKGKELAYVGMALGAVMLLLAIGAFIFNILSGGLAQVLNEIDRMN